jgi:hypothetical protein
MHRLARAALITQLIKAMRKRESWCGETHVQKAGLFLQDLLKVPLGLDFVLYKHGPYSFELGAELTAMRADELVKLQPQERYGPRIVPTERSDYVQGLYSKTVRRYQKDIEFVADAVGRKGVVELEQLATALFITLRCIPRGTVDQRASELTRVKPHISKEDARYAVNEVDKIIRNAGG